MEWNMLRESKKLYPHWLDKNENSNFSKHLDILNNQQRDIRHKIRSVDWARLLNKPLKIHKVQNEPYKYEIEFEVNVPRLKQVNIYKNPTIVNNRVVNSYEVINGYLHGGVFYENHVTEITNIENTETETYGESQIQVSDNYNNIIPNEEGKYYFDLISEKYYIYGNNSFSEVSEEDIPQTSLVHSESFIDNYSHFFRHIIYEDEHNEVIINKYVLDSEGNQEYKRRLSYSDDRYLEDNGKYELCLSDENGNPTLFYNTTTEKYCTFEDGEYVELDDSVVKWLDYNPSLTGEYFYWNDETVDGFIEVVFGTDDEFHWIFAKDDGKSTYSRIPLIETEDITPLVSNDKYVLEVYTWNDYHFLKGFPEIDFIDYNNNNIIDTDERTYDNLIIELEEIANKEYLTFRIHQYGIKLIEIFKDDIPIHTADFIIEKYDSETGQINSNFAHMYYSDNDEYFMKDTRIIEEANLDVDEYVYRLPINEEDKIYDGNGNFELKNKYDLQVTYYDATHPYDSEYDKILRKTYVCEDSIFYHDVSLDVLGVLYNVPRHVFRQPNLETYDEQLDFYSKTYPKFSNTLTEDDYHYQKRLEYYINNYDKIYFPCLEMWKYFHIDFELINRKVIVAEQNYSYLRTLDAWEDKYINELGKNKLESSYLNYEHPFQEEANLQKPRLKAIISPNDFVNSKNGILVDENDNYIKDINGTPVRIEYDYYINDNDEYVIRYKTASRRIQWYIAEEKNNQYQLKLTDSLKVVPNTRYQLRFCVKEYNDELNLKIIYKNNDGDVREVEEKTLVRNDCDDSQEYNELIYSNYKNDWGIECEYLCNDFSILSTAQNVELCIESKSAFKISDITLQRITINHFDTEYMKTKTDYNSCVYDLYADYNQIPSNIKYDNLNIFNQVLNRSLPLTKVGYFNFVLENTNNFEDMNLDTEINISMDNLLDVESGILTAQDNANITQVNSTTGKYQHTYRFNKYIRKGEYEIIIKPFYEIETNIIEDFNIDITMLVFNDDNTSEYETLTISDFEEYLTSDDENYYYKIPFLNESDNSLDIRIYRDDAFQFKDFKLIRKAPLTMEEITK